MFFRKKIVPGDYVAFDSAFYAKVGTAVATDNVSVFIVLDDSKTPLIANKERCIRITKEEYDRYKRLTEGRKFATEWAEYKAAKEEEMEKHENQRRED